MAKGKLPNMWSSARTHAQPPPSVADTPPSVATPEKVKDTRMSKKEAMGDIGLEKAIREQTKEMMKKDKSMMKMIAKNMGPNASDDQIEQSQERYFAKLAEIEVKAKADQKKAWQDERDKKRKDFLVEKNIKKGMSKEGAAFAADERIASEKLKKKNAKGVKKMFFGITDAFKKSPEELKEEKGRMARMFGGIKKLFGDQKDKAGKGGGLLAGLKKMMSGYSKLIMGLLGAGLLAALSTLNMKQLKKVWEGIKGAFVAVYEFLKPIVVTIWEWAKSDLLPGLVTFFTDQIESITKMFSSLKERFEGWGEMSFGERVMSVLGAIGDIGIYIWDTFKNLMKLVGGLLGIDGDFFKNTWESIKKLPATILKHLNNFGTKFGTWFKTLFDFSTISSSIASLINLTSILPNIIKEYLLDPAVTWLGDKFGFDTSWFTSRSVGEIIVDGAKFFFKKLMDFFDFDIKFDMPDWDVLQSFKDLVRPLLEKASWVVPDSLLDWVRAKSPPKPVVPPPEPPKTPAEVQAETKTREDTRGLKKGQWLQREKKKWSISSGRPAAEFGKAHGGAKGIKEMFGAYQKGDMPTPQPMDELAQIQKDEGFESGVYEDTMGIKTIGYGFNLERAGAQEALDKAGIKKSLADLSSGEVTMTEEEASRLMLGEMPHFRGVAERFVGKETWKNLSGNRQGIITNMAYNMGEGTLNKFKKLKAAIKSGDWREAQVQMKDSAWAKQVHGRADRLVARMGQNDTGSQLAQAQSTSDGLGSSGGGGIIIAPSNVSNTTTHTSDMYAHETTHRDTEIMKHTG